LHAGFDRGPESRIFTVDREATVETVAAIGGIVLGLVLLAGGGEGLVRGATTLARLAGVTPAVIGLTVVAMGTSLPELVVSVLASVEGRPDIAVGNVVGSNLFNVGAVLGVAALVAPLVVHGSAVRLEWPVMFVVSWLGLLLMRDGVVDRLEGGFFLTALVVFTAYTVRVGRVAVVDEEAAEFSAEIETRTLRGRAREFGVAAALVLGGMGLLVVGGQVLVNGAVVLARLAGWSERVIGLTIVAGGTSAPELAASVVAAVRGRTDVALANVIGSNIFNILGILGTGALILPLQVAPGIVGSDAWWMIGAAGMLLPVMLTGRRISRPEGAVLLAGYCVYLGFLIA
jgi:cation:H+ antiporter